MGFEKWKFECTLKERQFWREILHWLGCCFGVNFYRAWDGRRFARWDFRNLFHIAGFSLKWKGIVRVGVEYGMPCVILRDDWRWAIYCLFVGNICFDSFVFRKFWVILREYIIHEGLHSFGIPLYRFISTRTRLCSMHLLYILVIFVNPKQSKWKNKRMSSQKVYDVNI